MKGNTNSSGFFVHFLDDALGPIMRTSQHEDGAINREEFVHVGKLRNTAKVGNSRKCISNILVHDDAKTVSSRKCISNILVHDEAKAGSSRKCISNTLVHD